MTIHAGRNLIRGAAAAAIMLATPCVTMAQEATYYFDIPAQDLRVALLTFGKMARRPVSFNGDVVRGQQSEAVKGNYPSHVALQMLLDDSGLTFRRGSEAVIFVESSAASENVSQTIRSDATPANVQESAGSSAAAEDRAAAAEDEVIVTGSRIVRDGYQAPSPTTVVSAQDLEALAPNNVADYLNRLPQLGAPNSPRTTTLFAGSAGGANLLNARGLGADRTLVLLDGRRVVSAGLNSAVDINLLPTNLLQRVDVVTGGASAAYGSDAVAGVVNFILNNNFTGVEASTAYGLSDEGDGETFKADIALGSEFAAGRGHFLASAQYFDARGIDSVLSRDWYQPGWRLISNPGFTPTNAQPGQLLRNDIGYGNATEGGVILSGSLRGVNFGEHGSIGQFIFGDVTSGNLQAGGTLEDTARIWPLLPDHSNWNMFGRVSYELTDTITAYAEYIHAGSDADNWSSPYARYGNITVHSDNPYLPIAVRQALADSGETSFTMGRLNYDLVEPGGHSGAAGYFRRQDRVMAALEGSFFDSGQWQTYYQRGKSDVWYTRSNNPIVARYNQSIDVIANPEVGGIPGVEAGRPVCRSSLTDPGNSCVPMNIFGTGVLSQSSIDWVLGANEGYQARQDLDIQQDVWAIDGQYEPFSLWAGPVSIAAGYEWRKEQFTAAVDELSLQSAWFTGNFSESQGAYTVREFFGETLVPLLADVPLFQSLDLNVAIRRTDYSTSGAVTTWKAGLTWDVYEDLRLRSTRSRDIRAPNLDELFAAGTAYENQYRDPTQPGNPLVQAYSIGGGNPNLTPEIAETWTAGVVYRPDWLSGFSASVDYYKIDIDDAIVSLGAQTLIDQCYGAGVPQNPSACNSIVKANPDDLVGASIYTGGVNAQKQSIEGVDYEFTYSAELSSIYEGLPGAMALRLLASNKLKHETELSGAVTDNLGTPGYFKWSGMFTAAYELGSSRTTISARYIGPGTINNWPLSHPQSVAYNHFDSVTYIDLSESYEFDNFTLFAVIENALNQDPVRIPGPYYSYGTSTAYDLLGRLYRVGVRIHF